MLDKKNIIANLVSIPCVEIFNIQTNKYKESIFGTKPKIIIEASSTQSWYKYLGKDDLIIGIDEFGESGKANDLFAHFGFTKEKILKKIMNKYFK